jgi:hypothetical protein
VPTPHELTVIVCTRDRAEMLASALESITHTVPGGVDVLVVDSASETAATREAAEAAGVGYVRSEFPGLSIARNLGLRTSARPLAIFTDDDCRAVEGWIEPVLERFGDPLVGAVTGRMLDHTLVDDGPARAPARRFTRTLDGLDAGHGAVMAFRREPVLALGGFDDVLGAGRYLAGAEDLDMFCRMLDAGHAIVNDPACVVHHMNTRDGDSYTALHFGYGLGLGGLANKMVRLRFGVGVAMLAVLVKRAIGRMLRNRRNPRKGGAARAMLVGIYRGFVAGTRLRLSGTTFVDETRSATVRLGEPADRDSGTAR